MKEIPLTQGRTAFIDDDDYERVTNFGKWQCSRPNGHDLASRAERNKPFVLLHRFVLNVQTKRKLKPLDGNWLNCQKSNLIYEDSRPWPRELNCIKCGRLLPTKEFRLSKNGTTDKRYYRRECSACRKIIDRARIRSYESTRAGNLKKKFGITLEQWDALFDSQGRCCKICGSNEHKSRGWHTDHDHRCCAYTSGGKTCGKCIRAILCGPCNALLGNAYENVTILKNAIAYIERFANPISEVSSHAN